MQNLWSDSDAKAAIAQHAAKGIGEDLACASTRHACWVASRDWCYMAAAIPR